MILCNWFKNQKNYEKSVLAKNQCQVPAEIRHEGGETLRTSFSRDLAKCVNNLTIILGSDQILKLSKLIPFDAWMHRILCQSIHQDTGGFHGPLLQQQREDYWKQGISLVTDLSILVFDCICTTRAFWWSSIKYIPFWSINVFCRPIPMLTEHLGVENWLNVFVSS